MNTQEFIDKWTDHPGEREVIARDIEALVAAQLAALTAERDGLRDVLQSMLNIFDRGLPDGSIGRYACDEARQALEGSADELKSKPTTPGEQGQ